MKKIFYYFLVFTGIALLGLQACSLEETAICPTDPDTGGQETPIRFTSQAPSTRTNFAGDKWAANDSIGIYMLYDATPPYNTANGITVKGINSNKKYSTSGATNLEDLTPASSTQTMYYLGSTDLRFIAYYPFLQNIANYTIPIDVSSQDRPQDIDVLYSRNATGINSGNPGANNPVRLVFRHILSKLVINITKQVNTDVNIHGMSGYINKVPLTASFHLDSVWTFPSQLGTLGFAGNGNNKGNSAYDTTFQAILIPQDPIVHADEVIQFKTVRRLYSWQLPAELDKFEPGMVYTFDLTLNGEEVVEYTARIKPWEPEFTTPLEEDAALDGPGAHFLKVLANGLDSIDVRYIPGNVQFTMGTDFPVPTGGLYMPNTPIHEVQLSSSYHIMETEVTSTMFCKFLNDPDNHIVGTVDEAGASVNASYWLGTEGASVTLYKVSGGASASKTIELSGTKWRPVAGKEKFPITYATWYGAQAYAKWAGGSLPTEAQWEYAARGGVDMAFDYIDGTLNFAGLANHAYAAATNTAPVAVKGNRLANGYGLYDMIGNMREYCLDRFTNALDPYPGNAGDIWTDPVGTDPTGASLNSVLRGQHFADAISSTDDLYIGIRRKWLVTDAPSLWCGFRVVFNFN